MVDDVICRYTISCTAAPKNTERSRGQAGNTNHDKSAKLNDNWHINNPLKPCNFSVYFFYYYQFLTCIFINIFSFECHNIFQVFLFLEHVDAKSTILTPLEEHIWRWPCRKIPNGMKLEMKCLWCRIIWPKAQSTRMIGLLLQWPGKNVRGKLMMMQKNSTKTSLTERIPRKLGKSKSAKAQSRQ